jgi:hypothetical protein
LRSINPRDTVKLEEWFRIVISYARNPHFRLGNPEEPFRPEESRFGVPSCPTVRGMVQHAHKIIKHLGLTGGPVESETGLPDRESYITHLGHVRDFLRRVLADEPPPAPPTVEAKAPTPSTGASTEELPAGRTWQEAAERMKRLCAQGEPWTSYRDLAERLACSTATISKAISRTPELQAWAKPEGAAAPRIQNLNDRLIGRKHLAQQREPDPPDDAAEAELRKVFEEADPDERAFLNSIRGGPQDYQLWYIQQPKKARKKHRKACKQVIEDPTTKAWFLDLPLDEKLAYLDDPAKYQKSFPKL